MNTTSNLSASATPIDQVTQSLAALSEASSSCQDILARNQTLRTWISCRLRERLKQAREQNGLATTNPEAIFFNQPLEDGSISCQNVTDVLIENMRSPADQEAMAEFDFHTRHATLDPEHALTPEQNQSVRDMLGAVGATAFADYERYILEAWNAQIEHPQEPSRKDSATQCLTDLQRAALIHELQISAIARTLSESDQNRLSSALTGLAPGTFAVTWQADEGRPVALASTYAVTVSSEATDEPEGSVFLLMPCKGVERFESVDELQAALTQRLSGEPRDPHLVAALPLSDQGRLSNGQILTDVVWHFAPLSRSLLEDHVACVQCKQAEDLNFLGQQPMLDTPTWQAHVERAQVCAHLDDAMGFRFATLTAQMADRFEPDWRKYADQNNRDHLLALEARASQRKRKVDDLLRGTETLEQFAEDEIRGYMLQHLGLVIDPSTISVTVNDSISLGDSDPLAATYQGSLLEHAIKGLPDVGNDLLISPVPDAIHAEFSGEFIRKMLVELELHGRYVHALRERLNDPENLRVMAHHRDSLIAVGGSGCRNARPPFAGAQSDLCPFHAR